MRRLVPLTILALLIATWSAQAASAEDFAAAPPAAGTADSTIIEAPQPPMPAPTAAGDTLVAPVQPAPVTAAAPSGPATAPATGPAPTAPTTKASGPAARSTAIGITASATAVVFGDPVVLSGSAAPAASTAVVVERQDGAVWTQVGTTTSDAAGAWSFPVQPAATSTFRVRAADGSAASTGVLLTVAPRLTLAASSRGRIFVGAPVQLRVQPATWSGTLRFAVHYAGRVRATRSVQVKAGAYNGLVPAPGLGRLPVTASTTASPEFAAGSLAFGVTATARPLSRGARGADVRGLVRRLRDLNFHTPSATSRFDHRVADTVLAFRKSQRLSRTSFVDRALWHRLAVATPLKPRFASPARHIEVDKTRQILMLVRGGKVVGAIHVSTGVTGNTPEGRWRVYQKGGSYLYRFMAFVGEFGIHGYVPVPTVPASHGCVREPMWAASWTFRNTRMGDPVLIYR